MYHVPCEMVPCLNYRWDEVLGEVTSYPRFVSELLPIDATLPLLGFAE